MCTMYNLVLSYTTFLSLSYLIHNVYNVQFSFVFYNFSFSFLVMSSTFKTPEPTGTTEGPSGNTGFGTGTLIGKYQYHHYIHDLCIICDRMTVSAIVLCVPINK